MNQLKDKPLANPRLRETFERRAREQGHENLTHKADGSYSNMYLEAAWCGYQMHDADHQQQLQGSERIEVVAYLTAGFRDHTDKAMNKPSRAIMDAAPPIRANENREDSAESIRESVLWAATNTWERAVVDDLMTVAQHKRILANYKTPEYVLPFEISNVELRQLQEVWASLQTRCGRTSTEEDLNLLVHKGMLINRGAGRYGVTELGHFFLRNAVRDEIPSGIYYSLEHDNFYSKVGRQGQGNYFYRQWIDRKGEFPRSADE